MNALESLGTHNNAIKDAEKDLGTQLRSIDMSLKRHLLTPDEVALQRCRISPEFKSGPFNGLRQVVAKYPNGSNAKAIFLQSVADVDGRMLLRPDTTTGKLRVLRTLVKYDPVLQTVSLTSFGAQAGIKVSEAERTTLSAINGFYDPTIGTHELGPVRSEPGHVALTGAVLLGAYQKKPELSLHNEIHTFERKVGASANILVAATAANANLVGVAMPTAVYTYETWPQQEMLLWHPEEVRAPQAPLQDDAVARVQAAGFVSLRSQGLVGRAVNTLGSM